MTVKKESKGKPIFFCCEFAGGFSISPKDLENTFLKIKGALTATELKQAEAEFSKLN